MSAGKKRGPGTIDGDAAPTKRQKRQVTLNTFKKWQSQFEKEHQTISWL